MQVNKSALAEIRHASELIPIANDAKEFSKSRLLDVRIA